jgi:hypothetical protein
MPKSANKKKKSQKKHLALKSPNEQYTRLRCLRCNGKAIISVAAFWTGAAGGQTVRCCHGEGGVLCKGKMIRFGNLVTRNRTRSLYPPYSVTRERALRPLRGAVMAARAAQPAQAQADVEIDDALGVESEEEDDADELSDPDFVLPRDYNIQMRFTPEHMEAPRTVPLVIAATLTQMTTGLVSTGDPDVKERDKQTKLHAAPQKAAWRYSLDVGAPNAAPYKLGKLSHYEWCHLQGVAIGGKTVAANLACGHYAVNTYMAVIESVLSETHSKRSIRVTALCEKQYVADWVRYEIFGDPAKPPKAIVWNEAF